MSPGRGKSAVAWVAGSAALALAAAYVATLVLWPAGPSIDPAPVSSGDWFGAEQLSAMLEFRGPQRTIGLVLLAAQLLVLVALALAAPRVIERHLAGRPLLVGAIVAGGIALTLALIGLPAGLVAADRAREAGLLTQPVSEWLAHRAASVAIAVAVAAVAGMSAVFLIRRLRGYWWMAGTALAVGYGALVIWLWPVLVAPIFADFDPLPEGPTREEIVELADRAEVDVGEVLVTDTGERSTAIRAYVTGLGPTKRVVVSDNALDRLDRPALRAVLAHELAHVHAEDVRRALVWLILVAPFGLIFIQVSSAGLARARDVDPASPAAIPAIALALFLAVNVLGVPANHLSRAVEARADTFAMQLTGEPAAMIEFQLDMASTNLSDPDPPAVLQYAFASHPSTVQRIGAALAFAEEMGVGAPDPEVFIDRDRETREGS